MFPTIQTILVPQGVEYRAVCGGLRQVLNPPAVFPVPIGAVAVTRHLEQLHHNNCLFQGQQVLVMGLCGGLTPELAVGDGVLYESCVATLADSSLQRLECDRRLTAAIQQTLGNSIQLVTAVMSDRVISRATEKQQLAQQSQAEVVDMEGFAALQMLSNLGVSVSMLRVVSDDYQHDIPDLTEAINEQGTLQPVALGVALLKQPIAGVRLIRGSITSLKILQNLTSELLRNVF